MEQESWKEKVDGLFHGERQELLLNSDFKKGANFGRSQTLEELIVWCDAEIKILEERINGLNQFGRHAIGSELYATKSAATFFKQKLNSLKQ